MQLNIHLYIMNKYLTYFLIAILVFIGIFYIFFNNKLLEGVQSSPSDPDTTAEPAMAGEEADEGAETSDDSTPLTAADYLLLAEQAQQEEDEAETQRQADEAEAARISAEEAREAAILAQEEAHGPNRSGNISYDVVRNSYISALADETSELHEENLAQATQNKLNWDNAAADANVNVGDGQFVESVSVNGQTKWRCRDASLCYPNETPLFKCLPERDINLESKIYNLHRCKDPTWDYDTDYQASYDLKITNNEPGFRCRDRNNIQACEHVAYKCIPHLQETQGEGEDAVITYSEDTATINHFIISNGWERSDIDRSKYEGCDGTACIIQ